MDGENQSTVASAQSTWVCTSSFGCSPCPTSNGCTVKGSNCVCPGVFTTTLNGKADLFSYPDPPFNFAGITVDLASMKITASSEPVEYLGYLQPSVNINSQGKGYHLKFKNDGTVEAWIITGLNSSYAYSLEEGWHYDYFKIQSEYLYKTYNLDPSCSVVFVEDDLWVEGQIKGSVTVASANLIDSNVDTDVVLPGNITYASSDNSDGFALIGERNVLIGPQSPDQMTLKGIFVAQKGRFGRNDYDGDIKTSLEIYGSIISSGRVGTQWTSGSSIVSGYRQRETYFDPKLVFRPPAFVPYITTDFSSINWREVK